MGIGFEIPSKTFVVGEYLALKGSVSLVLASEPCFIVNTKSDDDSTHSFSSDSKATSIVESSKGLSRSIHPFHPDSPAARLYKKLDQKVAYCLQDPHCSRGGFGRSTAEYLCVFMEDLVVRQSVKDPGKFILDHLEDFVKVYQKHSCDYESGKTDSMAQLCDEQTDYKPSGADLVAQVCGGLCWYDGMNFICKKLHWPFPSYDIYVFHTGRTSNTHEHLRGLKGRDFRPLIPALMAAKNSLDQANLKAFCKSLNDYYDTLSEMGFSDSGVRTGVDGLREHPEVLAAKACGAMGLDTVIVVACYSDENKIKELGSKWGFSFTSRLSQAHPGACYTVEKP